MPERPRFADRLDTKERLLFRYRLLPTPKVEYVSQHIVDVLGYPLDAYYDDPSMVRRVVHPADAHTLDRLLEGGAPTEDSLVLRFRRANGTFAWIDLHLAYVRDEMGHATAIEGVARDVTPHKVSEQRMAAQYAVTRILAEAETLLDAGPDLLHILGDTLEWDLAILWEVNGGGNLLRYVAGWQRDEERPSGLLWASRHTSLKRGDGMPGRAWLTGQALWIPDVREFAGFARPDAAQREGIGAGLAVPIRLRQDVFGIIELFSHEVRAPDKDLTRLITSLGTQIGQFIARRRVERERKQLERQFYEAQKMEAVGHLAGGVAHDFNNLLTAILGYCEMLLDDMDLANSLRGDVEQIKRAGETAAALTRQLLMFSRRELLQSEVVDLNAVVERVQRLLRRVIGETIDVELHLDRTIPPVRADVGQMEQVVMNLALNARDAMPLGGTLTVETSTVTHEEAAAYTQSGAPPNEYVSFVVRDTGHGMSPEVKARLFEPFFTTKERGKGTGLGLATVYGIVKQSHGHIGVTSEPGRGTTFRILLPPAEREVSRRVAAPVAQPRHAGGETILLVEDDQTIRDLSRKILERHGYRIIAADAGHTAIDVARAYKGNVDLLLTDVVLPGEVSGTALAREIARMHPEVKLLYTSGYTTETIEQHGTLEGAFLDKPFTPDGLLRKVREALDA